MDQPDTTARKTVYESWTIKAINRIIIFLDTHYVEYIFQDFALRKNPFQGRFLKTLLPVRSIRFATRQKATKALHQARRIASQTPGREGRGMWKEGQNAFLGNVCKKQHLRPPEKQTNPLFVGCFVFHPAGKQWQMVAAIIATTWSMKHSGNISVQGWVEMKVMLHVSR